jgi:hypothetical protein
MTKMTTAMEGRRAFYAFPFSAFPSVDVSSVRELRLRLRC